MPLLQADNEQAAVARRGHGVRRRVASAASTPCLPPDPPRRVQASFDEQHTVGAELGRAELRPHPALQVGPMLNLLSPPYLFRPHISFVPYLFPPPPCLPNAFEDTGCLKASRPLVGFGVLIDNTIKGLTCLHEIMSRNLIKELY